MGAILQNMLAAGLRIKQREATLVLSLDQSNHSSIRDMITHLNGNQSRYRRLDDDGCRRAIVIHKLQNKARNAGSLLLAAQLREEVEQLKQQHALLNAQAAIAR